jgi:elongation factor Ts
MSISAADVKKLRDLTGAGMMDCKTALTENNGDIEASVDWLRKKGMSKADKKAGRTAAEGLIGIAHETTHAVVVEINSETDFVARNEGFQAMVASIAAAALPTDGSTEAVAQSPVIGAGKVVVDVVRDAVATIGENMAFRRSAKLSVHSGVVATYMHNAVSPDMQHLGKIGVLVGIETTGNADAARAFGRQVAMHVAATNPAGLTPDDIPQEAADRERAIFADQARQSGKPEAIIEKMVEGRMRKFYEEVALVKQAFVINPDMTVEQALKEAEGKIGAPAKITGFVRMMLGEGIEKEQVDFAAEVAAAVRG